MDSVVKFLQPYQLHPQADHFSVALLIVAVVGKLLASSISLREFDEIRWPVPGVWL